MPRAVKLADWSAYRYFTDSQNPESVSNLGMGRIVSARDYIQVRFSFIGLNEIVKEAGSVAGAGLGFESRSELNVRKFP